MNIFYLHSDPEICAQYHCDKHVVKMILETWQMLRIAHAVAKDPGEAFRASGWVRHPSSVWVRKSRANYDYAASLGMALCTEYTFRYHRTHAKEHIIRRQWKDNPFNDRKSFAPPPQVMPDIYKGPDTVIAYRNYYRNEKALFARYTNREFPPWFWKSLESED